MRETSRDRARADGIKFYESGEGYPIFEIPCPKCGCIRKSRQYSRKRSMLCDYCRKDIKAREKKEEIKEIDVETKYDKRFNSAVSEIENQVKDFSNYADAISMARKRNTKYGSIPEAMVAIELLKAGYRIIPQQNINGYKVDFCLPDDKVIVEVDGEVYHKTINRKREQAIQLRLGYKWRIIHIPAEKIRKSITKVDEIIKKHKELD